MKQVITMALVCISLAALDAQQLDLSRTTSPAAIKTFVSGIKKAVPTALETQKANTLRTTKKSISSTLAVQMASIKNIVAKKNEYTALLQQEERELNQADYDYFKSKYGAVGWNDFMALKNFIIENGYTDISEVLCVVTSQPDYNVYLWYGTSFICVKDQRIMAISLCYFDRIARIGRLNALSWLEYLYIFKSPIGNTCFAEIASLRGLRHLSIFGTPAAITSLSGIQNFTALEVIAMGSQIGNLSDISYLDRLFTLSPKKLIRANIYGPISSSTNPQVATYRQQHPEIYYGNF